jgi:hypothetical protein
VDDRLEVQLLGSNQRKSVAKVKAHLTTEDRQSACAGAVSLAYARAVKADDATRDVHLVT